MMESLLPRKRAFTAIGLTFTFILVLLYSLWTYDGHLKEVHHQQLPLLEINAIALRADEAISKSLEIAALSGSKNIAREYSSLTEVMLSNLKDFKRLFEKIPIERARIIPSRHKLAEIEHNIVKAIESGNFQKGLNLLRGPDYKRNKVSFNVQFQQIVESLNAYREQTLQSHITSLRINLIAAFIALFVSAAYWYFLIQGYQDNARNRKHIEVLLEKERINSFNASKLAALAEMAGGVAHEINNPLTIINGYAQRLAVLAEQDNIDKEQFDKDAAAIMKTVKRIAKTVKGLRTISQDVSSKPFSKVSVKTIINDSLALTEERFRYHNIHVGIADIDPELMVECRSVEVSQVLINLLSNAFQAIEGQTDKWIILDIVDEDTDVKITVVDSGKGIPSDIADRIMDPFFTTKPVGVGTGLGLSISKAIINKHNGNLSIDSDCPNTKFVIQLPKKQPNEGLEG